jgi:putative ABC transport system permease protein
MFRNFLTIAFRNLTKRKGYTVLNVLGLVVGMTCCLLIFHYVSFERSYDDFQKKTGEIVRVRLDSYQKGKLAWKSATSYPAIAPTMKKDYPEVENFCRLIDAENLFTNEDMTVRAQENKGYFADPVFLDMFDVQVKTASNKTALDAPYKMVISENMAKKYFGRKDPVGKKLTVREAGSTYDLLVTGVFKNYPANSHLTFDFLISYQTLGQQILQGRDSSNPTETSFGWYDFYTYIQMRPGADWKKLETKMPAFCDKYMNSTEWAKKNEIRNEIHFIPLNDIHLYSNVNQEAEVNGNGQAVSFLFLIAIFIVGIAWINYINMATARSVERAREVGMRKVLGAMRRDLIRQFLIESFLLNLVALIISAGLFFMLITAFDRFTGRDTLTGISLTEKYWMIFAGLFAGGTLLSGIYPAFILSAFQPVTVLKGSFKNTGGGINLRKGLIVLQFLTSVVLIAGTIIVYQQVTFMRRQQLGVNIEQTLVMNGAFSVVDSSYQDVFQPFKNDLLQQTGIKHVTSSTSVMGNEIYWTSNVRALLPGSTGYTLYHLGIDHDFLPAYGLKLVAGRNFSKDFTADRRTVMLNEAAVKLLGFKDAEDAVKGSVTRNRDTLRVVGVVSNYHHQGLQKAIDPMILILRPNSRQFYSVKIETADMQKTIASIEKIWNKNFTADPFNYFFLDDTFNQQYKSDTLFGKVFGIFAFLAILVASFGLLGLSAYNVLQRTKEIGIRKVLGASGRSILVLLSKDFVKLIVVALLLAIPAGWYIMNQWLQDFAYRIDIAWWVFALAGALALLIAVITISLQALKTVTDNPVKSLRTE